MTLRLMIDEGESCSVNSSEVYLNMLLRLQCPSINAKKVIILHVDPIKQPVYMQVKQN